MDGRHGRHHVQFWLSQVLRIYLSQGVWLYIDDIVIAADTEEEYVRLLRGVVKALADHRIKCKLSKCVIGAWSIGLLILSKRGI